MVEGRVEVAAGIGLEVRVGGAVELVPDVAPLVVDVVVPAMPLAVVYASRGARCTVCSTCAPSVTKTWFGACRIRHTPG